MVGLKSTHFKHSISFKSYIKSKNNAFSSTSNWAINKAVIQSLNVHLTPLFEFLISFSQNQSTTEFFIALLFQNLTHCGFLSSLSIVFLELAAAATASSRSIPTFCNFHYLVSISAVGWMIPAAADTKKVRGNGNH